MCIGVPMTVIEGDEMSALVEVDGQRRRVGMLLVGAQPAGTHLLVHADSAVRVLSEQEAADIEAALRELAEAEDAWRAGARADHPGARRSR